VHDINTFTATRRHSVGRIEIFSDGGKKDLLPPASCHSSSFFLSLPTSSAHKGLCTPYSHKVSCTVLDDNLEEDIFFLLIAEMFIAKLPICVLPHRVLLQTRFH
jgi:hypothetical protein